MQKKRTGFTLIELLVVIAIIAILAAILFPAFARARENARRASCMSNQKQVGLGFMQYRQDYDEKFPAQLDAAGNLAPAGNPAYGYAFDPASTNWVNCILPYLKSRQIFVCPSQTPDPSAHTAGNDVNAYLMNGMLFGISEAGITETARTYLMWEVGTSDWARGYPTGCAPDMTGCDLGAVNATSWPRPKFHLDGGNYLFADGHVKWARPENLFKNHWHPAQTVEF